MACSQVLGARVEAASVPEPPPAIPSGANPSRPGGRRRRVRLDDAITWFVGSWPYEGPHVPTADTVRTYSHWLKWLSDFALERDRRYVEDLDAELLRAAFQALLAPAPERSPLYKGGESSAAALASATRKLAGWLLAQGLPVADLSMVRSPRPPERIQPRLLPDEFRALEAAVLHQLVDSSRKNPRASTARDVALLYLLADTGLRAGEVVSMTVTDLNFETGRLTVRRGKGNKQRALSVLDPTHPRGGETINLLGKWITARSRIPGTEAHDQMWVSLHGRPLTRDTLQRLLSKLCQDAGLPANRPCHAFRRASFTERYKAQPRDLELLAARMGWSDKSHDMVNVYIRGAELELAADQAVPSLASLWHQKGDAYGPIRMKRPGPAAVMQRRIPGRLARSANGLANLP
jgi:integrase